jgi:hypothetical protein
MNYWQSTEQIMEIERSKNYGEKENTGPVKGILR